MSRDMPPHPIPNGDYLTATRHDAVIYTAGMTPRRDGRLIEVELTAAVRVDDEPALS
ncbi:hypothetical protein ACWDTP_02070 [Mycobacterium sp. NPDC003449]